MNKAETIASLRRLAAFGKANSYMIPELPEDARFVFALADALEAGTVAALPPQGGEPTINERERLERKAEKYRDRALHLEHLEAVALRYRDLWLICHENNPRAPEEGELVKLGYLRGLLFASTRRRPALPAQVGEPEDYRAAALSDIAQIFGLLEEGRYDEAHDYCRCCAEYYAPKGKEQTT